MKSTRIRRLAAAAAVIGGLAGSLVGTIGSAGTASAASCARVYALVIPGTWETNSGATVHGMLGPAVSNLPADVVVRQIRYDATAFPWDGGGAVYGKSKATAVANANAQAASLVARCPSASIALVGYSQGADAAGDVAAEIGTGHGSIAPSKLVSVDLLADPRRAPGDPLVGPRLTGQGSGGPRQGGFGWVTSKVHSICAPGDMYCNLRKDYYVSRVAGFLAETSDPDPTQIPQYYAEAAAIFGQLLISGGAPAVAGELSDAKARQQINAYDDFLRSGAHVDYAHFEVSPGVTALQWIHDNLAGL